MEKRERNFQTRTSASAQGTMASAPSQMAPASVRPHRVVFGSIERFIGVITEHFAGAFPTWLAPVQVKVMAMTDRTRDAVCDIAAKLEAQGLRVETDLRNEKIGFKIREAQMQKIPYMLIVGDKEVENGVVAVRARKGGDLGTMTLDAFEQKINEEVASKTLD